MLTLKTLNAEDWRAWRELRLQALRDAPYAFSSTLADWQGTGDSEQRWRGRLQSVAFNVIASLGQQPAGMVSATLPDAQNQAELLSMWVAPWARGRGVGDELLAAVLRWAAENKSNRVVLRVFEDNRPGIAFYRRHGFVDTGALELASDGRREQVMVRDVACSNVIG